MTETLDLELDDTPTIGSLSKLLGEEQFEHLSRELGGKRVFIPQHPGPSSPLAACLGLDAAQKISQIYAGMMFEVPVHQGRKAEIRHLRKMGLSHSAIAHRLRITRRTVQRILNAQEDDRQMDFFPDTPAR